MSLEDRFDETAHSKALERIDSCINESKKPYDIEIMQKDVELLTEDEWQFRRKKLADTLDIGVTYLDKNWRKENVFAGAEWQEELAQFFDEWNKRYFCVEDYGGKFRICEEAKSRSFHGYDLVVRRKDDFLSCFEHQMIQIGVNRKGNPIMAPKGSAWLRHEHRTQFNRVVYEPEQDVGASIKNLWRGWAYAPKEGSVDDLIYLQHLKENICCGNPDKFGWLIRWMAYSIRNPNEMGHTAPVLKGGEGWGKNCGIEPWAQLFGSHWMEITQRSQVTGHFNAHLRNISAALLNEACFAGDRSQYGPLKALITDRFLTIEAKGVDVEPNWPNKMHIVFMSNENWVVPAALDARRFTVFDVSAAHMEDTAYFNAMWEQLHNGGFNVLMWYFLNAVDLKDFTPRKHLETIELSTQKEYSLQGVNALWYDVLCDGRIPNAHWHAGKCYLNCPGLASYANEQHLRRYGEITGEQIGLLLTNFKKVQPLPRKKKNQEGEDYETSGPMTMFPHHNLRINGRQTSLRELPTIEEARAAWFIPKDNWPKVDEWQPFSWTAHGQEEWKPRAYTKPSVEDTETVEHKVDDEVF